MFFFKNPVVSGGASYTDRGDPAAYDYTSVDFTTNNLYHELDLSGIVGAAVRLVYIKMELKVSAGTGNFHIREAGNSNAHNTYSGWTAVVNKTYMFNGWVLTNASGKVEYAMANATWSTLNLTVRGWY